MLWATRAAAAQLMPAGEAGLTMGHVVLNVRDIEAHRSFWVGSFGARPITVGRLEGITIPGLVILFRLQEPTGPGEGETINHLGLKLKRLADQIERFDAHGWQYNPPRIGRENTLQTYVTGPDGFRMELVEDTTLPAPVLAHHLHYWLEDPPAVKRWYVERLRLAPTARGPYDSADLPGINLTFAPLGTQPEPGVATRGRLMDSIGFDVMDLEEYCRSLAAAGVGMESPVQRDPELEILSATFTDPWGVTIRLTEGLSRLAGVTPFEHIDGFVVARPVD